MDNYIFFSKSNWDEAPRLRHQVAELIRNFGGTVNFYQKPSFFWQSKEVGGVGRVNKSLVLYRTHQLIHHQLRLGALLRWLNATIEKRSIRKSLKAQQLKGATIISFNYDYYFLRDIFPKNKIVTIINDDFVAQAKLFSGCHAKASLQKTCAMSDLVLTVSYPLARQVSDWCSPLLFFPWADSKYKSPTINQNRNSVLLWAYVDKRIDFHLLRQCIAHHPDVLFYIVGPHDDSVRGEFSGDNFLYDNVIVIDSAKLDALPIDDFFAAIIPYKKSAKDVEAVTMSNKTLQLMSRGLPLITHGMPHFYEHEAIFKTDSVDEFVFAINYCRQRFVELQGGIEDLISHNQPKDRFDFLTQKISEIKARL